MRYPSIRYSAYSKLLNKKQNLSLRHVKTLTTICRMNNPETERDFLDITRGLDFELDLAIEIDPTGVYELVENVAPELLSILKKYEDMSSYLHEDTAENTALRTSSIQYYLNEDFKKIEGLSQGDEIRIAGDTVFIIPDSKIDKYTINVLRNGMVLLGTLGELVVAKSPKEDELLRIIDHKPADPSAVYDTFGLFYSVENARLCSPDGSELLIPPKLTIIVPVNGPNLMLYRKVLPK